MSELTKEEILENRPFDVITGPITDDDIMSIPIEARWTYEWLRSVCDMALRAEAAEARLEEMQKERDVSVARMEMYKVNAPKEMWYDLEKIKADRDSLAAQVSALKEENGKLRELATERFQELADEEHRPHNPVYQVSRSVAIAKAALKELAALTPPSKEASTPAFDSSEGNPCPACFGSGMMTLDGDANGHPVSPIDRCPTCWGTGRKAKNGK